MKVDPVFYMDKNVTACDLPEIIVCYKEEKNTYHVVKDICVDEGVPVHEKFLFGEKDSVKCSSNSKQRESEEFSVDDAEEFSKEYLTDVEGPRDCNQEDFIVAEGVKDSSLTPSEIQVQNESHENSKDQMDKSESKALTLGDILSREDQQKEDQNNKLQTCLVNDAYKGDKLLASNVGEMSFCAKEHASISGLITYSGPTASSGSLSVRSDASTPSGRSFAFPILQSEWKSSPVRMAKADTRRQKGWRHTFLCCRFSSS